MILQFNRDNFDYLKSEVEEQRILITKLTAALTLAISEKPKTVKKNNAAKS
jgi:hypothetical protein